MRLIRLALFACVFLSTGSGITAAGDYGRQEGERAYADSFGNLIVIGSSGYKRILVGKGWRAKQHSASYSQGTVSKNLDHGDLLYVDPQTTSPTIVICAEPHRLIRMAPGQSLHVVSGGRCSS